MYNHDRQMPPMKKVAANVGLEVGICFRCGKRRPTERAHIIDRFYFPVDTPVEVVDGLNNLLPLCKPCHALQPVFKPGNEVLAWAWFTLDRATYVRQRVETTPKLQRAWAEFDEEQKNDMVQLVAFAFDILDWPDHAAS